MLTPTLRGATAAGKAGNPYKIAAPRRVPRRGQCSGMIPGSRPCAGSANCDRNRRQGEGECHHREEDQHELFRVEQEYGPQSPG